MGSQERLEKLRPCGRLETYSTARHHLGIYNNVMLAATYKCSQPDFDLVPCIFAALKATINGHPNFGVVVVDEEFSAPKVQFARLPAIDLNSCVEIKDRQSALPEAGDPDEELHEVMRDYHSRGFDLSADNKPIWRLVILKSTNDSRIFTAAWFWHHAIADGTSALLFHKSFLRALNTLPPRPPYETSVTPSNAPLPLPFEEQLALTISWPFFLSTIAKVLLPSVFDRRPDKFWTGHRAAKEGTPKFRTLHLESDAMSQLAQLCRKERTTVTATIQCLLAAAILANLPADEFDKVKISVPISMRRFLKGVSSNQMTNAVASHDYFHTSDGVKPNHAEETDVLQLFSWDEARALKSSFDRDVAKEGGDRDTALLKYVSDMHKFFTDKFGKDREMTSEVSNLGVFKPDKPAGAWEIGRMTFSQCPSPMACAFGTSTVTGGDGSASINFCWCDEALEPELMNSIFESFRRGIKLLIERTET